MGLSPTVSTKESCVWLQALPISSLALRMDDNTCQHCEADVDHLATHGLSCKKSEGHHYQGLRQYFLSGGADFFWYKSHGLGVGGGCATFHT